MPIEGARPGRAVRVRKETAEEWTPKQADSEQEDLEGRRLHGGVFFVGALLHRVLDDQRRRLPRDTTRPARASQHTAGFVCDSRVTALS